MRAEPEFIQRLYGMRTFGIKLGLERTKALLALLGNPEREMAAIHVAGTNGKGSVAAMIEAMLRQAGYRTGLYTSPHLVRLNERMRVTGEAIADAELKELIEILNRHSEEVAGEHGDVTFFELTTALAFEYFRRHGVRIVVLETGMGGRLDSTNVVIPLVSVITSISLEHVQHLGATVEQIAGEKGGIIKSGRPVVCGNLVEEARVVIERIANREGAPLVHASERVTVRRISQSIEGQKIKVSSGVEDYPALVLPLLGRHHLENCAVSIAAVETAATTASLEIDAKTVSTGLARVDWPARCQVLSRNPVVLLDGAHNPGAAAALCETIREVAEDRPVGLIVGMCDDKDARGFLRAFSDMVSRCWTVSLENERRLPRDELARLAGNMGWSVQQAELADAIADARGWALEERGLVCITGSLFLAGEVLALHE